MRKLLLNLLVAALFIGAVVILIQAGLPQRADFTGTQMPGQAAPVAPEVNAVAPNITLSTLDGSMIDLWSLRGSPVLINFWATWCVPCAVEMPDLQALYAEYADEGLRVLAVNLAEPPSMVAAWVDEYALTFDVLLDPAEDAASTYYRHGPPATVVVSPEGVITAFHYGPVSFGRLQDDLAAWLNN